MVKGPKGGIDHVSRKIKQLFHSSQKYNISISRFTENKRKKFGKSRFTAAMEITIHEEKKEPFHISAGNKKGRSRVTKIPFTTLILTAKEAKNKMAKTTKIYFDKFARYRENPAIYYFLDYNKTLPCIAYTSCATLYTVNRCTSRIQEVVCGSLSVDRKSGTKFLINCCSTWEQSLNLPNPLVRAFLFTFLFYVLPFFIFFEYLNVREVEY